MVINTLVEKRKSNQLPGALERSFTIYMLFVLQNQLKIYSCHRCIIHKPIILSSWQADICTCQSDKYICSFMLQSEAGLKIPGECVCLSFLSPLLLTSPRDWRPDPLHSSVSFSPVLSIKQCLSILF